MGYTIYFNKNPFPNGYLDFYTNIVEYSNIRIKNNQNFIFNIAGKTGSGKNLSSLYLTEQI